MNWNEFDFNEPVSHRPRKEVKREYHMKRSQTSIGHRKLRASDRDFDFDVESLDLPSHIQHSLSKGLSD